MTTPRILLDCDPGIDDAFALIYLAALHHAGEIELVGVTTTAGNIDVDTTARNAAFILSECGLGEIPVAPGHPVPLEVPLVTTPETHGPAGLGYVTAPDWNSDYNWRDLWNNAAEQDAQLIVTGPLTNAALAGVSKFSQVTVMGGAVNYRGNTTPTAEWNFWVDPHAAKQVFGDLRESNSQATLCSLEVTEQFLIAPPRLERLIAELGEHPVARHLPEILRFYFEFHQEQGEGYQAQIHDLLTCIIALGKVDFLKRTTTVDVEAESQLLRGTSVADLRGHWDALANAHVVTAVDIVGAHAELTRAAGILARRV
ncbi:nucleoside hydrolase [Corynebacterium striatum]|uniref:nucleoside hydrolase n=1 Tax=Corynebacterium TaxID=1716 RepID=UPI0011C8157A|nr:MULTISPECIES: nucleoside hydrolase [Corynebacterium]QQU79747.1 nucleoside hydrolase [Corynebacterium striatum]TXS64056.1 nucleoside hydrolase [Corynebacterium sp. LK14]